MLRSVSLACFDELLHTHRTEGAPNHERQVARVAVDRDHDAEPRDQPRRGRGRSRRGGRNGGVVERRANRAAANGGQQSTGLSAREARENREPSACRACTRVATVPGRLHRPRKAALRVGRGRSRRRNGGVVERRRSRCRQWRRAKLNRPKRSKKTSTVGLSRPHPRCDSTAPFAAPRKGRSTR